MTQEEYVKLVCHVLDNPNGRLLLKHLESLIDINIHSIRQSWLTAYPIDDRALYTETANLQQIKALVHIIDNPKDAIGLDIAKYNEELDNE